LVVRVGRYGPYVQRADGQRASLPDDLPPDELTVQKANELIEAGSSDRLLGQDPDSGLPVMLKAGRFGPYVTLGGSEGDPPVRTSSLLKSMDPATLSLSDALRLLTLPRVVGVDPADGEEIVAANGRYGPYLKKGRDSRSLEREEQLFEVTLDEALAIFAQPKTRRGTPAAPPLRELGLDPVSGAPVVVKEGRFGPYVTDGQTNASLRKGDSVEEITLERAAELLEERRASGPKVKGGTRKPRANSAKSTTSANGRTKAGAKATRAGRTSKG
jgi:DNA topoisomerase-1